MKTYLLLASVNIVYALTLTIYVYDLQFMTHKSVPHLSKKNDVLFQTLQPNYFYSSIDYLPSVQSTGYIICSVDGEDRRCAMKMYNIIQFGRRDYLLDLVRNELLQLEIYDEINSLNDSVTAEEYVVEVLKGFIK